MTWDGPELRDWQREALDAYLRHDGNDFLAVATPGAGKTTFALRLASELLEGGSIRRIVIVVPTEHLKTQWANAAHACGISIDPTTKNADGLENRKDYRGAALTYAQVASQPDLHRFGCAPGDTLVILDEIHHAGDDRSWGDAVKLAFTPAARRLALSGTPFRSDSNPIPFVKYGPDNKSTADYTYGYGRAIRDEVCRQVDFHFYDGEMRWKNAGSVTSSANLSAELVDGDASAALETALDPTMDWMGRLLTVADRSLTDLRVEVPNAGGLVIAYRKEHARAYAQALEDITGEKPTVVLSDDGTDASGDIERFARGRSRWLVAVRMVSEGVDVPRLAVGVYATKTKTEMFFRQAVGRFVRRREDEEHPALIFAPAISSLRIMAAQIEKEIQHEIDLEREEYESTQRGDGDGQGLLDLFPRVPVGTSEPTFHQAIHGGEEYTAEENAYAEILLKKHGFSQSNLASMRNLVRDEFGGSRVEVAVKAPAEPRTNTTPAYRMQKNLKQQLNGLARRISIVGKLEHPHVQGKINQHMGVSKRANASIAQLEKGLTFAHRWLKEIE